MLLAVLYKCDQGKGLKMILPENTAPEHNGEEGSGDMDASLALPPAQKGTWPVNHKDPRDGERDQSVSGT